MSSLNIAYVSTAALIADPANARTHSEEQVGKIVRSIERFGFNNPILVDQSGQVIAGHGRLRAAQRLGMQNVPSIRLDHMTSAQRKAYALADNRLAELAGWDKEILAIELQGLLEIDRDFEITDIGFEMAEIDIILDEVRPSDEDNACEEPPAEPENVPQMARPGDLWQLGRHLLFCGDALDPLSYRTVLGNDKARLVFTDPPYNVPIKGHVSGLGKARHREFVQASGEMSQSQFADFLVNVCQRMHAASLDGSIHYICMDWRHIEELIRAGNAVYSELKNVCVWVKPNGGMGTLYRSRHELVAVFKAGKGPHCNNVQLGSHGRYRTNVWEYAGMSGFQAGRDEKLAMHPTVKPAPMIADAILDCSLRGDIVLDPFAGSGSTILAAERTGRLCRAIELDPAYVDVCLARFAQVTGIEPVNLWTGETFPPAERSDRADHTAFKEVN
jgi:DNA modification methylase